ncbi:uncharacterized protein LACBIDRAFT_333610 [Laccaria bicolor S238N-H82]|uniref:Predicted protein n=1 Tax=Laccaria bicolor (strain S238N-H82 / ATCC MYA-4686) TaxID=486041 RepID=B0DWH8_LACBS|nr:uncharacterized protein LACBIDRAFT_333610 [Laccaria bicolor S238N-H82]EDR01093.1 predicted protein [Laccaria bicolor S238N-H82]|eukprot:XP_001888312.1 predicted protein [Laccaria bicolor S238N-H82]
MPLNTPTSNLVEEKVRNHIFNTVNDHWGIRQFSKTNLPLPIFHIHFIAHPNEDNSGSDGQQPTNHWTMYLETSPTSSVHIDVAPDDNDLVMVMLDTEQVNYDAYNVFHKSLPVVGAGEGCSSLWGDTQDAIDGLGMYWSFPPGTGSFAREIAWGSL